MPASGRRYVRELGLTTTFEPDRKAREAYGVGNIPHMVIIGRDSRVSAVRVGYSDASLEALGSALNRALAAEPQSGSEGLSRRRTEKPGRHRHVQRRRDHPRAARAAGALAAWGTRMTASSSRPRRD